MTQNIVINRCYGGFGLSHEAVKRYWEIKDELIYVRENYSLNTYYTDSDYKHCWSIYNLDRDDHILVQVVRELGIKANADLSELVIVEIPDDVVWVIDDYDGMEEVHEAHRSWS